MPDRVKSRSPGMEQARTRLARRAVIAAAGSLFSEGGYATTTMTAISRRADVPEPTVYRLFSSKLGILKVLIDVSIAGDHEPIALPQRASVAALFDEPDARKVLAGFAEVTAHINKRTNHLYRVLGRAADSDPEAAVLFGTLRRQRDQGQEKIVQALHRKRKLRAGMKAREAADIVHALMSPEVYALLVTDRGWTPDRYQQWATDTLIQQLI